MRTLLVLFVVSLALSACATDTNTGNDYTLYLVRHAEKAADDSHDPQLSGAGKARASKLATNLQDKGIRDIWSSDYQRTRDTATPLAKQLGLTIMTYDPDEPGELQIQLGQRQQNALIIGHSNTIPELASILCQCRVADMQETEFDRLIVIAVHNGTAKLQTLTQ